MRGLWQKLDAVHVQNGQSLSKYQGFGRKLVWYKRISIFLTYFYSRIFVHSIWTIRSHILKFQPYLTSFAIFMHLINCFELNDPEIKKHHKWTLKWLKLAWYHHFTHIACAKKMRGLRQKLDALCLQNGQSLSKYQGFGRKLVCYKRISIFFNLFQLQTFCALNMNH